MFYFKERKRESKLCILCRYFISWDSLALYCPRTWLATNWDSLLAYNLVAPISKAGIIPAMRASYSSWLLLKVNSNYNACSITISPGPSSTIPAPLLFMLEELPTNNAHSEKGFHRRASWARLWSWPRIEISWSPSKCTGCRIMRALLTKIPFFLSSRVSSKLVGLDCCFFQGWGALGSMTWDFS